MDWIPRYINTYMLLVKMLNHTHFAVSTRRYKWRPSVRAKRNGGNGVVTNIGNSVVTVDTRVRNRGRNNSIQNGSLGHTNLAYN